MGGAGTFFQSHGGNIYIYIYLFIYLEIRRYLSYV